MLVDHRPPGSGEAERSCPPGGPSAPSRRRETGSRSGAGRRRAAADGRRPIVGAEEDEPQPASWALRAPVVAGEVLSLLPVAEVMELPQAGDPARASREATGGRGRGIPPGRAARRGHTWPRAGPEAAAPAGKVSPRPRSPLEGVGVDVHEAGRGARTSEPAGRAVFRAARLAPGSQRRSDRRRRPRPRPRRRSPRRSSEVGFQGLPGGRHLSALPGRPRIVAAKWPGRRRLRLGGGTRWAWWPTSIEPGPQMAQPIPKLDSQRHRWRGDALALRLAERVDRWRWMAASGSRRRAGCRRGPRSPGRAARRRPGRPAYPFDQASEPISGSGRRPTSTTQRSGTTLIAEPPWMVPTFNGT